VAGLTSAVAIVQPFMAFLQDEFQLKRKTATTITVVKESTETPGVASIPPDSK